MAVKPYGGSAKEVRHYHKYRMIGDMGEKEIIKFASDVKEGNLEPTYKS